MSRLHATLYEFSGGRFVPRWFAGAPVMVLKTVRRRSGREQSTPVLYLRDGDVLVVLAANAGAYQAPAWWLNLQESGAAEVVIGRNHIRVRPRELTGPERERLWRAFVGMYPQAEDYTRFTNRDLPLIALEPVTT
jgi:F420H(2)-dependent quinone reductase